MNLAKLLFLIFNYLGFAPMKLGPKNAFIRCMGIQWTRQYESHDLRIRGVLQCRENGKVGTRLERAISGGRTSVGGIAALVILSGFSFGRDRAIGIVNTLEYLRDTSTNGRKDIASKRFKGICIASLVAWLPKLLSSTMNLSYNVVQMAMYYIAAYTCDVIILFTILQYSLVLYVVKGSFERINEELAKITSLPRTRCIGDANKAKISKLSELRYLHCSLSDACQELAELYSKSILFRTLYIFVTLTLFAYYIAQPPFVNADRLARIAPLKLSRH